MAQQQLDRNRTQWAVVSENCSIPGASAAPIAWAQSEEDAKAKLEKSCDKAAWVAQIPWGAEYIDEVTEEWVCRPLKILKTEQAEAELLEIEVPGSSNMRSSTLHIYHGGFPYECDIGDPELDYFTDLVIRGYDTPSRVLTEFAAIAAKGELPPELTDPKRANHRRWWLEWLKNTRFHSLF